MKLILPEPPSMNRYWRNFRGRMVISAEGRTYRDGVQKLQATARPLESLVSVRIDWYRGRRSGDLDNRSKVILDALQGIAFVNDSQVVELHMYRFEDKKNPRAEVSVEAA